jgi:hypothetical protein
MKAFDVANIALSLGAASALLSGCGGSQAYGSAPPAENAAARASRVAPAALKQLLYISDRKAATVNVYEYPSLKEAGKLTGFGEPAGECVDASGDVWITDSKKQQIVEYAQGGSSPIATLSDAAYEPNGCSIDPTTGDLAVANVKAVSGTGNLAIYKDAKGTAKLYDDPDIASYYFCSYDKNGTLTVDGDASDGAAKLANLAAGGTKLETLTPDQSLPSGGSLEWASTTLIIGQRHPDGHLPLKIFRFTIDGRDAKLKGSGPLNSNKSLQQFTLHGPTLITADEDDGAVYLYRYPKTGAPFNEIKGLNGPFGTALSIVTQ